MPAVGAEVLARALNASTLFPQVALAIRARGARLCAVHLGSLLPPAGEGAGVAASFGARLCCSCAPKLLCLGFESAKELTDPATKLFFP